ncbi:MAG: MFS transporter [Actinobacteria bacterium]|nr:MFS transporter [Actinomycetota bacterium]
MRKGLIEDYFPSLVHRDYRTLLLWVTVSNIGTWLHNVALGLYIHELYRSPGWLGLINFFSYAPTIILFLPAGSLADTRNRKYILVISQAIMAAGALALAFLVLTGYGGLAGISICVFMMGIGIAFNFPAWLAIVPELVSKEALLNAVSLNAASWNMARFIGPMLAGVVIAFASYSACFFVNSISFFPFILALLLISLPATPDSHAGSAFLFRTMAGGIYYSYKRRLIRNLLITYGLVNALGLPYIVFIPVFGKDVLGKGNFGVSAMYAATGLGAVVGAPLVTRLHRAFSETMLIKGGVLGISFSLLIFSWSTNFWLSLFVLFCAGLSFLITATSINTTLQLKTDPRVRGRVMSLYVFMIVGAFPIGGALLGIIADAAGMSRAMSIGALTCMFWGAVIVLKPELLQAAGIADEI